MTFDLTHRAAILSGLMMAAAPRVAFAINNKPAVDRDTVVMAIGKEIFNLDADVSASGDSQRYAWQMYNTLYELDRNGEIAPSRATGMTRSPDGLAYTFTLRGGVKFHNGQILKAEDVVYSMERILDPAVRSTRRPNFAPVVAKTEALDDKTVVFTLKEADGAFLNKIAGYLFIVPKAYAVSLGSPEAFARAPIGTGPYRFVERKIGQSVTYERFDDYFGPKPGIKHLIMRLIAEPSSRVNALLAGEVDLSDGVPASEIDRLKQTAGLNVYVTPIGSPLAARLYTDDPASPLSKAKVRLALNYAIDVNAIIKDVLHGAGAPLTSQISSYYTYGVNRDLKPYVRLGWLPTSGYGGLRYLILPAIALGWYSAAGLMRLTRSNMMEILTSEYVRMARIKGIPESVVVYKHALKNAALPVLTFASLQFSVLMGGAVSVESVFAWPGMGTLILDSISTLDYTVVQAAVTLSALMFTTINLVVDLLYAYIDPRIRYG
jgi:ABC-type transport system substrate-binding protein